MLTTETSSKIPIQAAISLLVQELVLPLMLARKQSMTIKQQTTTTLAGALVIPTSLARLMLVARPSQEI
jgi:hypothetical protein